MREYHAGQKIQLLIMRNGGILKGFYRDKIEATIKAVGENTITVQYIDPDTWMNEFCELDRTQMEVYVL